MVEIFVDGIGDLVAVENERTLGEVISGMRQWASQQQRVLVDVRIDGGPPTATDDAEVLVKPLDGLRRIEFSTESLYVVIANMLASVHGAIPDILTDLESTARALRRTPDTAAVQTASHTIERCAQAHEMLVKAVAAMPSDVHDVAPYASAVVEQATKLRSVLKQCGHAFEHKDYVLLADCCEFELSELLNAARIEAERVYTRLRKMSQNSPRPNQG